MEIKENNKDLKLETDEKENDKKRKPTSKKSKSNEIDISELITQMESMKKQIEDMKKQNKKLLDEKTITEKILAIRGESNNDDFKSDDEITVISQTVGGLNLSTNGNGEGTVYRFNEFGEIQDIPFGDLKDICKHMKRFAQQGAFYIANDKAVEKLRLKTYYNRMISYDDMIKLFEKDSNTVISLYNLATDLQKEQIISLIENKRLLNEEVDGNILTKLEELSGKNLIDIGRDY